MPGIAEDFDVFGDPLTVGDTGPATAAASPSANTSGARRTASTRR